MENQKRFQGLSRRRFISQVLPACSLVCLGAGGHLWGSSPKFKTGLQQAKHKFDEEFPGKLTLRQVMSIAYQQDYIPFLKLMSEEIGGERLVEILKKRAAEHGFNVGKIMAKQSGSNDFAALKKIFSPESPNYKNALTMSITENSEKAYEIKVTECIWAGTFLKAEAGDLGFAAVCYGDYAMATGFNPKIKMVRDKTLMQGHDCCNHRYLLGA